MEGHDDSKSLEAIHQRSRRRRRRRQQWQRSNDNSSKQQLDSNSTAMKDNVESPSAGMDNTNDIPHMVTMASKIRNLQQVTTTNVKIRDEDDGLPTITSKLTILSRRRTTAAHMIPRMKMVDNNDDDGGQHHDNGNNGISKEKAEEEEDDTDGLPIIPNVRLRFTNDESTKMRQRWWEAVRVVSSSHATATASKHVGRRSEVKTKEEEVDDNSFSSSTSSSVSDHYYKNDNSNGVNNIDPPPSFLSNAPFDEGRRSVVDFEQCCVRSSHPLHCAIYNHALSLCRHTTNDHHNDCDHNFCSSIRSDYKRSDMEIILHNLLRTHGIDTMLQWKDMSICASKIRHLEMYDTQRSELEVIALMDSLNTDLHAAGYVNGSNTQLTPLQLAILWDLPTAVRVLCEVTATNPRGGRVGTTTTTTSSTKNLIPTDEDERGRTPLMLACEFSRSRCIEILMRVSSVDKLDRRERVGGNNVFHLCCMGLCNRDCQSGEYGNTTTRTSSPSRVDALNSLLRHTSTKDQKLALLSINSDGRNPLHLACLNGDQRLLERLLECHALIPGTKISRALMDRDKIGYDAFTCAVMSDSFGVVEHLLATRFAIGPVYESWFSGCPLIVAVSRKSVAMVELLLDVGYGASDKYSTRKHGTLAHDEVNRALLEAIRMTSLEKDDDEYLEGYYEIICLLITRGGANPHQSVPVCFPGKPNTRGDKSPSIGYSRMIHDESPILWAVRAGDVEAVRDMITYYTSSLSELKKLRRSDPLLRPQPESYFAHLEEKEDEAVQSSFDAAIVTSLYLLLQTSGIAYGKIVLILYGRGQSTLACNVGPRNLSQRALLWLENSISNSLLVLGPPILNNNYMEGCVQAPLVRYCIKKGPEKKSTMIVPHQDTSTDNMDWSYVLAELPWFYSRHGGVSCNWMQENITKSSGRNYINRLAEDEFYLVVGGQKLLAHKSIVSARSGKLAAHIRFTESHSQDSGDHILIKADQLPLFAAMMLLTHCYHGSITFGLKNSSMETCRQLLELALIAEEYLCPSLLLECELRLLMQRSFLEKNNFSPCICLQCSNNSLLKSNKFCPSGLKCLEKLTYHIDEVSSLHCEAAGVYFYNCVLSSNENAGLISPETCLDVLATAQQLEQSLSDQEFYRTEYYRSGCMNDPNPSERCDNSVSATGSTLTPFAAAKRKAIWILLRNFSLVLRSDAFLRQIKSDDNDDNVDEGDDSFVTKRVDGNDNYAIFLLQTCLEELHG